MTDKIAIQTLAETMRKNPKTRTRRHLFSHTMSMRSNIDTTARVYPEIISSLIERHSGCGPSHHRRQGDPTSAGPIISDPTTLPSNTAPQPLVFLGAAAIDHEESLAFCFTWLRYHHCQDKCRLRQPEEANYYLGGKGHVVFRIL